MIDFKFIIQVIALVAESNFLRSSANHLAESVICFLAYGDLVHCIKFMSEAKALEMLKTDMPVKLFYFSGSNAESK